MPGRKNPLGAATVAAARKDGTGFGHFGDAAFRRDQNRREGGCLVLSFHFDLDFVDQLIPRCASCASCAGVMMRRRRWVETTTVSLGSSCPLEM